MHQIGVIGQAFPTIVAHPVFFNIGITITYAGNDANRVREKVSNPQFCSAREPQSSLHLRVIVTVISRSCVLQIRCTYRNERRCFFVVERKSTLKAKWDK